MPPDVRLTAAAGRPPRPDAWPGGPFPLGRDLGRRGHQLRAVVLDRDRRSGCACSTRDGTETSVPLEQTHLSGLARLPARHRPRPALRLPRRRPATTRPRACSTTRPSCWSTPTPARSRATFVDNPAVYADNAGRLGARSCPARCSCTTTSPGATTARPHPVGRHRHLRAARARLHHATTPTCPPELRGTYARAGPSGRHRLPERSASPRSSCCRSTTSSPNRACRPAAWSTTGATTSLGFFAPHEAYATQPGNQVREFKAMVRALHAAGIEVILDVVYNHTAEGGPDGPMLSLPRHRQRLLLPPGRRRPVAVRRLHRLRQHLRPAAAVPAAADHGLAALLDHRDARRRIPLRPRVRAGPRRCTTSTSSRRSSTRSTRIR